MGRIGKREYMQHELSLARAPHWKSPEGAGYRAQSFASLLKVPLVVILISLILFGPIVLTSFMKFLPGVPLNIWVVGIVIILIWKWLS